VNVCHRLRPVATACRALRSGTAAVRRIVVSRAAMSPSFELGSQPTHVSATSIDGHGSVSNQVALVRVHGAAILDPGDLVDDG
jgi:hypothetical protein